MTHSRSRLGAGSSPDVEVSGDVGAVAAEWDELSLRTAAPPFARPGWIEAWWRAFGSDELQVLTLRSRGRLRAVLPLRRRDGVISALANEHTPSFEIVAADQAAATTLMEHALRRAGRRLELRELDAAGATASAIAAAAKRCGRPLRARELRRAPSVRLGDGAEDYPATLSGKRRRDLKRRWRRLEDAGRLEVAWEEGGERLDELLVEGLSLEGSGWKEEAGSAIASSETTSDFYTAVARWAAARGLLRLGFLRLDGRALAFQFTLWDDRRCYLLKTGFDPAHRREAPGIVLLDELIARAHALGLERAELLGDEEPHKMVFAQACRGIVRAQSFAPTLSGRLDRIQRSYARPVARRLGAAARSRLGGEGISP